MSRRTDQRRPCLTILLKLRDPRLNTQRDIRQVVLLYFSRVSLYCAVTVHRVRGCKGSPHKLIFPATEDDVRYVGTNFTVFVLFIRFSFLSISKINHRTYQSCLRGDGCTPNGLFTPPMRTRQKSLVGGVNKPL